MCLLLFAATLVIQPLAIEALALACHDMLKDALVSVWQELLLSPILSLQLVDAEQA